MGKIDLDLKYIQFKYNVGDKVKYFQHDGFPWGGVILRRENLGVPSYWIDTHVGWISESKIIKLWEENRFADYYDQEVEP